MERRSASAALPKPRRYRQGARADAAADTGRRIVGAFVRFLQVGWFEDITLEQVAGEAGVTAQTVIRRFGGKQGLLEAASEQLEGEVMQRRRVPAGASIAQAVAILVHEYEQDGDLVIRLLAQEARHPALRSLLARGRKSHRRWVAEIFAAQLEGLPARRRKSVLDTLVVATDVYSWHLLRRDMHRSQSAVASSLVHLVTGALDASAPLEEKSR